MTEVIKRSLTRMGEIRRVLGPALLLVYAGVWFVFDRKGFDRHALKRAP